MLPLHHASLSASPCAGSVAGRLISVFPAAAQAPPCPPPAHSPRSGAVPGGHRCRTSGAVTRSGAVAWSGAVTRTGP